MEPERVVVDEEERDADVAVMELSSCGTGTAFMPALLVIDPDDDDDDDDDGGFDRTS